MAKPVINWPVPKPVEPLRPRRLVPAVKPFVSVESILEEWNKPRVPYEPKNRNFRKHGLPI